MSHHSGQKLRLNGGSKIDERTREQRSICLSNRPKIEKAACQLRMGILFLAVLCLLARKTNGA